MCEIERDREREREEWLSEDRRYRAEADSQTCLQIIAVRLVASVRGGASETVFTLSFCLISTRFRYFLLNLSFFLSYSTRR